MKKRLILEVCVDSVESVLAAQAGGANRVELCQALFEGGITPSPGLIEVVKRQTNLPVAVMLRPRGGDFCYSRHEFDVMQRDLRVIKSLGADLVVTGILTPEGRVDSDRMRQLVDQATPLPLTFHRAFDMSRDPAEALEDVVALGIERILTSGQEKSVLEGLDMIQSLVKQANDRVTIMPGGGITERNLSRILEAVPVKEIHVSASVNEPSAMAFRNSRVSMGRQLGPAEYGVTRASQARVSRFREMG